MKKILLIILLSIVILSSCSSEDTELILDEEKFTFELGFDGEVERSFAKKNSIELVATYTSNNKGNILESNKVLVNNVECQINSITPQSFQLGEEITIKAVCNNEFKEPQINGIVVLEYLQGSTKRLTQGEFLLTVDK